LLNKKPSFFDVFLILTLFIWWIKILFVKLHFNI